MGGARGVQYLTLPADMTENLDRVIVFAVDKEGQRGGISLIMISQAGCGQQGFRA